MDEAQREHEEKLKKMKEISIKRGWNEIQKFGKHNAFYQEKRNEAKITGQQ